MDKKIKDLLFKNIPIKVLLKIDELDKPYSTTINHEIRGSYSHVIRIVNEFEKTNLVCFEKKGSKKIIRLTDKGEEIVKSVNKILNSNLDEDESKKPKDVINKLDEINDKIDKIYEEELKNRDSITKEDSCRIGKRIGPYKRELNKIKENKTEKQILNKIEEIKKEITEIMKLKEEKKDI